MTHPVHVEEPCWQRNDATAAAETQQWHCIVCARFNYNVPHGTALAQSPVVI